MALIEHELRKQSGELQLLLNEQLANLAVSYVKLHQYHWFVKGMHFQTLHEMFESLYETVAEMLDELAERMLAIGIKPASTLKEYLALTRLEEGSEGEESGEQMLRIVASDFEQMIRLLKKASHLAETKTDDPVTADMLNTHIKKLQEQVWMLQAMID